MYEELIGELYLVASGVQSKNRRELLERAADAIAELQNDNAALNGTVSNLIEQIAELSKPRWIPVTERLPEDGQWVLVWGHGQKIPIMMFRESGAWIDDQFEFHTTVTHWMPLPEPPKEETE